LHGSYLPTYPVIPPSEKLNGYLLYLSLSSHCFVFFFWFGLLRFPSLRPRGFIDGFVEAGSVWSAMEITSLCLCFEFLVSAVVMDGLVVDAFL
jgi:hypothetical protein